MLNDEKKKRIIINLRELNDITKFNYYLMFLQLNIISTVLKY